MATSKPDRREEVLARRDPDEAAEAALKPAAEKRKKVAAEPDLPDERGGRRARPGEERR